MNDYFPTKVAKGVAFCNRQQELKRLKYNIDAVNPVLIMSPRRYGKTSLSLQALSQVKLPYVIVDLYKAFSEEDIERFILNGIGTLLGSIEKKHKQLISLASDFFSTLHVNVSIEKYGLQLDFSKRKISPAENILNALKKLHDLAEKRQKKIVLYLDEFQSIAEVCQDHTIEAAIREVAQQSEYIVFLFSGSDRHLIEDIFGDKKKPFYNLCDIITLGRISEEHYTRHLHKASNEKWGKPPTQDVIDRIFLYTERHSYYFNKLCSLVWQGDFPTVDAIDNCWENLIIENKSIIERELGLLTLNQRKILTLMAELDGTEEPFGRQFLSQINLSNSSASRAMQLLINKDYIYLPPDQSLYKLLDPLMKSTLAGTFLNRNK